MYNPGIGRENISKDKEGLGVRLVTQDEETLLKPPKGTSLHKLKRNLSQRLSAMAAKMVSKNTKDLKICIFSNDCWGAEFYRCTGRPYNTPFVGLMIMAPCYLRFLKRPHFYLNKPLHFSTTTRYPGLQEIHEKKSYPVGVIEDIEIHFLHYKNQGEAIAKWNSRKLRIDWDHLYIKFSMDKDYAEQDLLHDFETLPYQNKISFSKKPYESRSNVQLANYTENGAQLFTRCFKQVDMLYWFRSGFLRKPGGIQYVKNLFISRFLKIT